MLPARVRENARRIVVNDLDVSHKRRSRVHPFEQVV